MDPAKRAKVFWSGGSQAVRLPREFRFDTEEVAVRREGDAVILEPVSKRRWPKGYWAKLAELGAASDLERPEPPPPARARDRALRAWSKRRES